MKVILLLLLFPFCSSAQKVEQYSRVTIGNRIFSGGKKELFVKVGGNYLDIRDSLGKEIMFEDEIDALNYLGRMGWKLMQEVNVPLNGNIIQSFIFKKEMELSEAQSQLWNRKKVTND